MTTVRDAKMSVAVEETGKHRQGRQVELYRAGRDQFQREPKSGDQNPPIGSYL